MIRAVVIGAALFGLSCSDAFAVGEPCFDSDECGSAQCIETTLGRRCMRTCSADDIACEEGEACVGAAADENLFVCLPGGEVSVGSACTESIDCVVGAICVGTETRECARICSQTRTPTCTATEQCTALSGDRGFCETVATTQ